jgi:hypothetical protein
LTACEPAGGVIVGLERVKQVKTSLMLDTSRRSDFIKQLYNSATPCVAQQGSPASDETRGGRAQRTNLTLDFQIVREGLHHVDADGLPR